jgi:hypothetical protein
MLYGKDAGYWDGENLAQLKDIAIPALSVSALSAVKKATKLSLKIQGVTTYT